MEKNPKIKKLKPPPDPPKKNQQDNRTFCLLRILVPKG